MDIKRSSALFRNMLIYLLAVLVPVFILVSVIYYYFVNVYYNEVVKSNENNLNMVRSVLDTKMAEIINLSYYMSDGPDFTNYRFETEPLDIIRELKKMTWGQSILKELILYKKGYDYLYSSNGSFTRENITNIYNFNNWSKD
jgi:hypothetical protein